MADLIDRQAAIDALEQIFDRCEEIEAHLPEGDPDRTGYKMYPDYMTVWKYLHQLPSAQPEPRWIPCSERLPEEDGLYLVTSRKKATAEEFGFDLDDVEVRKMRFNEDGWRIPKHIPEWINGVVHTTVLAWMPLPEPWREEE